MDAVASSSDRILTSFPRLEAADLLQKLSLDSETKTTGGAHEIPNKAMYGENGSQTYSQYGAYASANSAIPTIGQEGQLPGLEKYHYPSPYYKVGETAKGAALPNGGGAIGNKGCNQLRPGYQNSYRNSGSSYAKGNFQPTPGYQDQRFNFDRTHLGAGRNNNFQAYPYFLNQGRPTSDLSQTFGYMNQLYPTHGMYGHYGNAGYGYGSYGYDAWKNGQTWYPCDNNTYKNRSRNFGGYGYGKENMEGLNELNRGPRARSFKAQEGVAAPTTLTDKEQNIPTTENQKDGVDLPVLPDTSQYNKDDFPGNYAEAKFFVIKSYSEDDVHKSIKYNVWSSTPNGNKKLDTAYSEASAKSNACPVFLLFSVNTSGQFVGLAEMVGPVDYEKTVEYWQQDKWVGCFPLKWHIVKDVPNGSLRHILIESNENKPVTNSRDTQEVKFEQGMDIIKIFKEHSSKTCILDDFGFYESRQKIILERKANQKPVIKQVDIKANESDATDGKEKDLNGKDGLQNSEANGDAKKREENGANDSATQAAANNNSLEKKVTSNGVASAC